MGHDGNTARILPLSAVRSLACPPHTTRRDAADLSSRIEGQIKEQEQKTSKKQEEVRYSTYSLSDSRSLRSSASSRRCRVPARHESMYAYTYGYVEGKTNAVLFDRWELIVADAVRAVR